jgi:integrase/recombinase XerC
MAEGQHAARLTALADGAAPPRVELALFEEMLAGWQRQQQSRRLSPEFVRRRERVVRRFAVFTGGWPWCWSAGQLEAWVAGGGWAHSTVRLYQGSLACFLDCVCDPRYGWVAECEARAGARPAQVCHEGNTAVHVSDYEGRPEQRPLSRAELQALFDTADDMAGQACRTSA